MLLNKLFGKYAGIASGVAITVLAVIQVVSPDLLSTDLALTIMGLLGIHAGTSVAQAGK